MKSYVLIALIGVAACTIDSKDHLDSETMTALSQQKKNFENEVQDAEYDESMLQLDMNVNNKVLITAQQIVANREVPTSGLIMWDDQERTGTELDLDDGEENEIKEVAYSDADLESARLAQNVQTNN